MAILGEILAVAVNEEEQGTRTSKGLSATSSRAESHSTATGSSKHLFVTLRRSKAHAIGDHDLSSASRSFSAGGRFLLTWVVQAVEFVVLLEVQLRGNP